jgi:hypothetical protein
MLRHVVWSKFTDVSEAIIALMMEAASTSETSVNLYETTWCSIPEDSHLHSHCCDEISTILNTVVFIAEINSTKLI